MFVRQVNGEPTRFYVESSSLECPTCAALYSRLDPKNNQLHVGSECPKCRKRIAAERTPTGDKAGTLDIRLHLVDVAVNHPVGRCSCEHWNFTLGPKVAKLTRADLEALTQGQARALRCSHIEAARQAALDIAIGCHERERGNGKQLEEAAP